jgi:hypothetical protein
MTRRLASRTETITPIWDNGPVSIEVNTSFSVLLASLSPDALTRGKQFERLVKWWLTQDPIWSRKIENGTKTVVTR